MTIDLRYGDTIEQMKLIPDKSIDAIICDLPYGTSKTFIMNKIVTTYLNGAIDPQRKHKWIPSIEPCRRLIESANAHGCDVVIITDCITDKDGMDV